MNEAILVGKHWVFKYKSTEECQFFVDNEFITRFKPVRCDGYIGFYQWSGSITICNLTVSAASSKNS